MNTKKILTALGIVMCGLLSGATARPMAVPENEFALLPPMSDRIFWNGAVDATLRKQMIDQGERVFSASPDMPGEELYMEYVRTGIRTGYEKAYGDYRAAMNRLAMAACVSGEEKYVRKLEAMLIPLCRQITWILPAHDVGLKNWKKQIVNIDLVSSAVGWQLALMRQVFRSHFRQETLAMLDRELERRIVAPFERMLCGKQPPHWLRSKNNWNIVCLANVAGTLLGADLTPERRRKLLEGVIRNSNHFLIGFGKDGYCSEGMSYWSYGFGHYLMLSLLLFKATDGEMNLMDRPQACLAAEYPEKIRISDTLFPAFSDCTLDIGLPKVWIGVRDYLMKRSSPFRNAVRLHSRSTLTEVALLLKFPADKASGTVPKAELPPFSEFPDAGIFVMRPLSGTETRLAAAVKGGSNDEFHNHNDVGSYVLAVDGNVSVAVDPGAEHYDGRSFSARRYESRLNNSFGHSVPRINGQLQIAGKDTDSKVLKKHLSDTDVEIVFDIRKAYRQIDSIRKLERTFRYSRIGSGTFEVADTVSLSEPGTFETAVITFGTWKQTAPDRLLLTCRGKNVAVTVDTGGNPFRVSSEEIRENIRWKENPHRIAITLAEPVKEARIRLTFRIPEEA